MSVQNNNLGNTSQGRNNCIVCFVHSLFYYINSYADWIPTKL